MRFSERLRRKTTGSVRLRVARRWLRNSGLGNILSSGSGEFEPAAHKLWMLFRYVRRRKPSLILEFGIGHSTIAMAEALRQNGFGDIVAVDANPKWVDRFRSQVPSHYRNIRAVHSSLIKMTHNGEPCHRYEDVPDMCPDLLLLDGPDPRDVPDWTGPEPIAVDPVLIEPRLAAGARLIVDARLANCAFLDRHLTRRVRRRHDDIFLVTTYDFLS